MYGDAGSRSLDEKRLELVGKWGVISLVTHYMYHQQYFFLGPILVYVTNNNIYVTLYLSTLCSLFNISVSPVQPFGLLVRPTCAKSTQLGALLVGCPRRNLRSGTSPTKASFVHRVGGCIYIHRGQFHICVVLMWHCKGRLSGENGACATGDTDRNVCGLVRIDPAVTGGKKRIKGGSMCVSQ